MSEEMQARMFRRFGSGRSLARSILPHWEPLWSPEYVLDRMAAVSSSGHPMHHQAILDAESGRELVRYAGDNDNTFREWPLDDTLLGGRPLRLRVVDQDREGWGHINFGGIFVREESNRDGEAD